MDLLGESRDDRLIEDYLFSGYKPADQQKSAFEADQQFARPIEDEDLFCVRDDIGTTDDAVEPPEVVDEVSSSQFDFDRPFRRLSDEPLCETTAGSPGKLFEDEASDPLSPLPAEAAAPESTDQQEGALPETPIDDIFLDDYSESGDAANNENARPQLEKSYSKPPPPPQLTAAQVKRKLLMEKLRQQAIAMEQNKPRQARKIRDDSVIELELEGCKLVPDSRSKLIFSKTSNKAKESPSKPAENAPKNWAQYTDMLRKQICAKKRKVWESFQAPADAFDEDEELIGTESIVGSPKRAAGDDNDADAESDEDEDVEDLIEDADDKSNHSNDMSEDEADISESDLEDPEEEDDAQESDKSAMDCDNQSSNEANESDSESEDEIVRRKIIYDDDEDASDDDNNGGGVQKFIDNEVEVDDDL